MSHCSSSIPENNVQPNEFTESNLEITNLVARWHNDSLVIMDPSSDIVPPKIQTRPKVLHRSKLQYPYDAVLTGLQETLYIRIFIDSTGRPRKAVLLKTIPFESGSEIFIKPVLHAIMFWKYSPAISEGRPESIWIATAVKFHIVGGVPTIEYIEKDSYP